VAFLHWWGAQGWKKYKPSSQPCMTLYILYCIIWKTTFNNPSPDLFVGKRALNFGIVKMVKLV
jgi:hypothetical protein